MIHPNRFRTAVCCSLSLLAGLLLTGCPQGGTQDVVTITYDQVGACNGYEQTSGPGGSGPHQAVSAGPNAAFVAFRIVTLDNSKSSKDFNFDPGRLFINLSDRHFMDSNLSLARDLGVFTAAPTTIPKGKIMGNNGITVTTVPTMPHADTTVSRWTLSDERRERSASRYSLMSRASSRTSA